jgi:hypothetical protein
MDHQGLSKDELIDMVVILEHQLNDLIRALVVSGEVNRCVLHADQILSAQGEPNPEQLANAIAAVKHAADRIRGRDATA